jgi:hypothetical protein
LKAEEELTMLRVLLAGLLLAVAATAPAQMYRWVDKDGRVRYSDQPPPAGIKGTTLQPAPLNTVPSPAGDDAAAKDAKKGPLTPAEQEAEFRKRQMAAQKAREKDELGQKDAQAKQENCTRARQSLATFESGIRISRVGADGERYYLEDAQRNAEMEQARQQVSAACG